uniref:Fungal lipase-type domain-containing protein n=1 Tax=Noctiluca scintillans TaxID=2966 RepID=A0A7S1F3E4_NOCSC|mmetsp:Transcript_28983/g.76465  ORF Transcript_28983/g.76465 Transcript_28983/m.76465 type:complete len:294 (+) Transcript_28983:58-939(+)
MRPSLVSVTGYLLSCTLARCFVYDEAAAKQDMWTNQAMGCAPSNLSDWSCGLPCDTVPLTEVGLVIDSDLDNLIVVGHHLDDCLMIVRGTKNIENAITDVKFVPEKPYGLACPDCSVHSGFYESWIGMKAKVTDLLEQFGCSARNLQITGHSLGGSIAALAAFDLVHTFMLSRLYTYGQPRTGNPDWTAEFDRRLANVPHVRVVEYMDPVPHLSPTNFLFTDYAHTPQEVWYNRTALGDYVLCEDPTDKHCSYQFNTVVTWTHGCDHCSYLGMNPCDCGSDVPNCQDPTNLVV